MSGKLAISIGQCSDKGRKDANQDFHGVLVPEQPLLSTKGIVVAIADGISTSGVAHVASESAVKSLLTDYFCTSEAWSVKTSAQRVIAATNSWLHAQTRRSQRGADMDSGYVCTLSAMVLKSATAHIFHVGDSRVYRTGGTSLEQLTDDHRVAVSSKQSYLGRALGAKQDVEIDYQARPIAEGDLFVLATDGVYEHVEPRFIAAAIRDSADDLDRAARRIVEKALENGSTDNLTIQVVRIDQVPAGDADEAMARAGDLPLPPLLEPRMLFDGYRILRQLHASSRSHIYLAADVEDGSLVAIKIPSIDQREDAAYRKRFAMEEWVARRIDSAHVLKPRERKREQRFLYVATEFVEGQTLAQWMADNPRPDLERVRGIVEQIAKGLRAFHRKETLHQDLRPENIMIDKTGTVKIIDFGSARVAGVAEAAVSRGAGGILGAAQYAAPEYFLGEGGTTRSDLFSLGVIAYQMITGRLPYGAAVPRARTRSQQRKLRYRSARDEHRDTPAWIDGALAKAVSVDPRRRYGELSEFVHDLRHPNAEFTAAPRPILERNPLLFWKLASLVLSLVVAALLYRLAGLH
jgi:serine/threonine protein phosphatase PrpC/predicted Ser/Thr protein kinase